MMTSPNVMRFAVMFVIAIMESPLRRHETQEVNLKSARDASKNVTVTKTTIMNQFVKKLVVRNVEEIRSAWMTA